MIRSAFWLKFMVVFLIFFGESISIYAEMMGAREHDVGKIAFGSIFIKMFIIIAVAGGLLIAGYMLGFQSFQNIWIVSVTSITSILIMEPLLGYLFFHQLPGTGAIVGLILGVLGFLATMFL